ncbi:MAG: hypothetical protein KC731_39250 [Myxococcales bacterium]|nr:hypothetical protein [Myxococcales bacterium]
MALKELCLLIAALGTTTACSSEVIRNPGVGGGEGGSTSSAGGSTSSVGGSDGGTTSTGGEGGSGGADPCAGECLAGEVCAASGECYPARTLTGAAVDAYGYFGVSTAVWSTAKVAERLFTEGRCHVYGPEEVDGELYVHTPLDAGTLTVSVDGGSPLTLPPYDPQSGGSSLDVSSEGVTAPGTNTFELVWSGGADFPAGSVTFGFPAPITLGPVPPLTPGEPWILNWDLPAFVNLDLDYGTVSCFAEPDGTTLIIPPGVTTWIADNLAGLAYPANLAIYGDLVSTTLEPDGSAAGQGRALQLQDFLIYLSP